jgi:hypothetical protein
MTNWWSFTGDWEASIRRGTGLYERGAPACGGDISNGAAAAAVGLLAEQVQALVPAGKLSRAEAHPLEVKLGAATRRLEREQAKAGANVLHAFANQVQALLRGRRLSRADGQPLIAAATCLITRLETGRPS